MRYQATNASAAAWRGFHACIMKVRQLELDIGNAGCWLLGPISLLTTLQRFSSTDDFQYLRGNSVLAHTASEATEICRLFLDVIARGVHHTKASCVLTSKRFHSRFLEESEDVFGGEFIEQLTRAHIYQRWYRGFGRFNDRSIERE